MATTRMYEQAKSIADAQSNNCQKVRERMKAADEILHKICDVIRESGLIDGFDDLLHSLEAGDGFHLPFPDHSPPLPNQGTVNYNYISSSFFAHYDSIKPIRWM